MGDISEHFSRSEFACYCGCGLATADHVLITILEDLRNNYNSPVRITPKGGCRCKEANDAAGGSMHSCHMEGMAADITVDHVPATHVQFYLKKNYPGQFGIGSYPTFTHIDSRFDAPGRWKG